MSKSIFFILFIFSINTISFGQSKSLSLDYRFGIPIHLKPESFGLGGGYNYQNVENLFDQGLVVNYAHSIWKKHLLYGNIGFDLSRTRRYQNLVEFKNDRHIDNLILNDNRFDFHFGIEKKFALLDSKLMINVGWRLVVRNSFKKSIDYSTDLKTFDYKNGNTIDYKYDLTTHHGEFYKSPKKINQSGKFGNDFFAGLNIRMSDNVYFNFNLNFTTHNIFYYDYHYELLYYADGNLVSDDEYHGIESDYKFGVKDLFFYVSTGVSFNLGK